MQERTQLSHRQCFSHNTLSRLPGQSLVTLRSGSSAPRAEAALLAVNFKALVREDYYLASQLAAACMSTRNNLELSSISTEKLIRKGFLVYQGTTVILPKLTRDVVNSLIKNDGTGGLYESPFDDAVKK